MVAGEYRKNQNVDRVAQKWLAVPETSTLSERVLSICGLLQYFKRLNLLRVSIENQVFCYININKIYYLQKYSVSFHVDL